MNQKIAEEFSIEEKYFDRLSSVVSTIGDFKKFFESEKGEDITKLISSLLSAAISMRASDIHIEPEEKITKIRFRIDGLLEDASNIDQAISKIIFSRIKLLSGIKLNVFNKPQDGRFAIILGKKHIEARVSLIPSNYGDSIVIRILNPENILSLDDLGIRQDILKNFEKAIEQPNGMILVTGPTGSGKTTTLYAILKKIQSPSVKIITIEDPIEYRLDNITQTQIDQEKGYTFGQGLKAIVRQDPDVILVGEIRDNETSETAIQAALTGHLVLATLHTNDSIGAINRLMALGALPHNIAPALNLVVAQRLARKLCPLCAKKKKISEEQVVILKEVVKSLSKNIKLPKINDDFKLLYPVGCDKCNNTGYLGRVGLYEMFFLDDEMKDYIVKENSTIQIKKMAQDKGLITMRQDGIIKVIEGVTTLEEIQRVVGQ
jgi:type II secretory ATPase GspE/PulE/Tfp pilus assembly ATPase PilB-like protein